MFSFFPPLMYMGATTLLLLIVLWSRTPVRSKRYSLVSISWQRNFMYRGMFENFDKNFRCSGHSSLRQHERVNCQRSFIKISLPSIGMASFINRLSSRMGTKHSDMVLYCCIIVHLSNNFMIVIVPSFTGLKFAYLSSLWT